jgi:hypothetical protein
MVKRIIIIASLILLCIIILIIVNSSSLSYEKVEKKWLPEIKNMQMEYERDFHNNQAFFDELSLILQEEKILNVFSIRKEDFTIKYSLSTGSKDVSEEDFKKFSLSLYSLGETMESMDSPLISFGKGENYIYVAYPTLFNQNYPGYGVQFRIKKFEQLANNDYLKELSNGWYITWRIYPPS